MHPREVPSLSFLEAVALGFIGGDAEVIFAGKDALGAVRGAISKRLRVKGRPLSDSLKVANGSRRAVVAVGLVEGVVAVGLVEGSKNTLIDSGVHDTLSSFPRRISHMAIFSSSSPEKIGLPRGPVTIGDFSGENGLPDKSPDFFTSDIKSISRVKPQLPTVLTFFSPSPGAVAWVCPKGIRSLEHGDAEPLTTRNDPNFRAPNCVVPGGRLGCLHALSGRHFVSDTWADSRVARNYITCKTLGT
jgi:hypothetical protein